MGLEGVMIRAVPSGGWLKVSRGLESQALGLSVGPTVLEAQTGASGACWMWVRLREGGEPSLVVPQTWGGPVETSGPLPGEHPID